LASLFLKAPEASILGSRARAFVEVSRRLLTSIEETDTSVVPRIGESILWGTETYKVTGILHDIEDMVIIVDVVRVTLSEEG